MKKKIFLSVILCFLGLCIFTIVNMLTYNNDKEGVVIDYLEDKYNQEFTIHSEIKDVDNNVYLYAYNVSPVEHDDIIFMAGKKREEHIFPFIPPIESKVFFDNYFDEAKNYITNEVLIQDTYILYNSSDISDLSDTIYSIMEEINLKLSELGFTTTKYTCSITLSISVNQNVEKINFFVLDKSKIYDSLYEVYYK